MATTETDTALATTEERSGEMAVSSAQAMARHEIEGAIVIANRFPRNVDKAFAMVMKSCNRFTFAAMASYSYPRGGTQITGPSVNLAREVARCWGNIRYGCDVVYDDEESRTVRGWAWDLETNTKETQDASFKKLIYRKQGGWQTPDERDLRELTNKHGAICVRNCLLHLVPPDLIEDAMGTAKGTINKDAKDDPDKARKKIIIAFQGIGVSVEDMELYLGHPLRQAQPTEVADLRAVWKSISDGNSVWAEYVKDKQPQDDATKPEVTMGDLTGAKKVAGEQSNEPEPEEPPQTEPDEGVNEAMLATYKDTFDKRTTKNACSELLTKAEKLHKDGAINLGEIENLRAMCKSRQEAIGATRGAGSKKPTA